MLKGIIRKSCQRKINSLRPAVSILLNSEIPTPSLKEISNYARIVSRVNFLGRELEGKPDSFFKEQTLALKEKVREKTGHLEDAEYKDAAEAVLDEILPFYFACVREAAKRTVRMRHFDVQVLGGIILHKNKITEMATGEGKTLAATLPAALNALTGRGVHIVTVNDYLAKRDREWMGPVYEFLGLSVGVIQQDMAKGARQAAYSCDITYGTNNEFGFDYLRDNMATDLEDCVQRGYFYAVVDEVDSILVDEARTPLIISGPAEVSVEKYYRADRTVRQLKAKLIIQSFDNKDGTVTIKNLDGTEAKFLPEDLEEAYEVMIEEKTHNAYFTLKGEKKCEKLLGVDSLQGSPDKSSSPWTHYLTQAARAHYLFKGDKDYIVKDGKVLIVDEFTGRLMSGRRWSDGLHQAIEAKEGLRIQEETQTLASVTLQNYFKMYKKLAGMTGTAYTEANELNHIYNLDVIVIPTNRPLIRDNYPDRIYKTKKAKFDAVIREIEELYLKKRPMLVGTTSIEDSEELSFLLSKKGISHNVLNAKYHEREAFIVAQAGRLGQVTIATNMAGRGTDIILGGNIDYFIKGLLKKSKLNAEDPDYREEYERQYNKYKDKFAEEHRKVVELGGLHIIGTQRHEARRIDNQLRGRAGRQGDPGSSRFYVSLGDDLMRLFGSERIYFFMEKFGFPEDQPIEHRLINRSLEIAQKRVEGHNFEIRKQLLQYDNVMNKQREVIYEQRRHILEREEIKDDIFQMLDEVIEKRTPVYFEGERNIIGFTHWLKSAFGLEVSPSAYNNLSGEEAIVLAKKEAKEAYRRKEEESGSQNLRQMEKVLSLWVVDSRWKEHLLILDSLKEGIHLRGYAHTDPLVEYQKESYLAYQDMLASIKEGITELIFKTKFAFPGELGSVFSASAQKETHAQYSPLKKSKEKKVPLPASRGKKAGRNEPCPCGSGKKYKRCCGR